MEGRIIYIYYTVGTVTKLLYPLTYMVKKMVDVHPRNADWRHVLTFEQT